MLVLQPATARAQEDFEPEEMTSFMIQVPHGVDGMGLQSEAVTSLHTSFLRAITAGI